jgi:uncharacterized protein involved in cysteine biosynthesis
MIEAAARALSEIFSPQFRAVLWKSIGLALVLIIVFGIVLHRVLAYFAGLGEIWAQGALGGAAHMPLTILTYVLSIAAGFGIIIGSIFLMPAVTAIVASLFVDEIAGQVEVTHYPSDLTGQPLPVGRALIEGAKTALLAVLIYLLALPFVLFAGLGLIIFFLAAAFLLGREYFELVAMRFMTPAEAKRLRKIQASTVFTAGLLIAAFVSIPILNLATPLFGTAFMMHVFKRLSGSKPERALVGQR